eukprot:GHVH01017507.1.p1 GENE.GHVH01017507.1~~GHVH01017507.1.p1  ORF type:complete len:103 (+),score=10.64 GHVH01017507.1:143-451(+)
MELNQLYEVLGVKKDASSKDIRQAYLIRAKLHHPDKSRVNNDSTSQSGGDHHKAFIAVKHAYDVLSDDAKRANYDVTGQVGSDEDFNFASKFYSERLNAVAQ